MRYVYEVTQLTHQFEFKYFRYIFKELKILISIKMIEARRSEPTGLKKLLYILTMLLIIFLAVIIVLACMVAYKEEKPPTNDLCTSKNCIRSGNSFTNPI